MARLPAWRGLSPPLCLARNRLMALAEAAQRSPESLVAGEPAALQEHVRSLVRSLTANGLIRSGKDLGKGDASV